MRALLFLFLFTAPLLAQWGRDRDGGMGEQLLESVRDDLARVLNAAPADRRARIAAVVKKHGASRIEALKRFRNPELAGLFRALLQEEDWHLQHRALLALEQFGDPAVLPEAWKLLRHPSRRLREKAAIACLKLWDGRDPPADFETRLAAERDFYVRQCLLALRRRFLGASLPVRVQRERVVEDRAGLRLTPFLRGPAAATGPGAEPRAGTGRPAPATRWVPPLLGYGEEEVADARLPSFSARQRDGYHTGLDVGAYLDGAGFYAAAAGVVRLVHVTRDRGTVVVVEHRLPRRETVFAVYLRGGDTVFVAPGEKVAAGQLLGTIGLGFSAENGGRFAHLHYGLYRGPFAPDRTRDYEAAPPRREVWYDPARFLDHWIGRTRPLLPALRKLDRALSGALRDARAARYGAAHAAARRVRDHAEPGSIVQADAVELLGFLEQVPARGLARARRLKKQGYPRDAVRQLEKIARQCRGLPGAGALQETRAAWEADPLFGKALQGEARLEATRARTAKLTDRAAAHALWRQLLADYGDTCLRPRLEQALP